MEQFNLGGNAKLTIVDNVLAVSSEDGLTAVSSAIFQRRLQKSKGCPKRWCSRRLQRPLPAHRPT